MTVPRLWVVAGPNGAGKTTLAAERLVRRVPVVNPDSIALDLPRLAGRLDQREAGVRALQARKGLLAHRVDFAIETTLSGHGILRFLDQARDAGYEISLNYVGLATPWLAVRRVTDRVLAGGHEVPLDQIMRRYRQSLLQLPKAMGVAHHTRLFDNSDLRRRLIAVLDAEGIRWLANDLPIWARGVIDPFTLGCR